MAVKKGTKNIMQCSLPFRCPHVIPTDGDPDDLGKRPRSHMSSPASAFGEVRVRGYTSKPTHGQ